MPFRPLSALRHWVRYAWFSLDELVRRGPEPRKPIFPKSKLDLDFYDPRESFNSLTGTLQMALVGGGVAWLAQSLLQSRAPAVEMSVTSTLAPFADHRDMSPWKSPEGGGAGGNADEQPRWAAPRDLSYFSTLPESALAFLPPSDPGDGTDGGGSSGTTTNGGTSDPAGADGSGGLVGGDGSSGSSGVSGSGLGVGDAGGTASGPGGTSTPAPAGGTAPTSTSGGLAGFVNSPSVVAATGGTQALSPATLGPSTAGSDAAAGTGIDPGTGAKNPPADTSNIDKTYAQLPLSFEMNSGQAPAQVVALSHGPGFGFYLTNSSAVVALSRAAMADQGQDASTTQDVLAFSFPGSNTPAQILPGDQQIGRSNYFTGSDPSQWLTNIAQYGSVTEKNIYPGVDLTWSSAPGKQLEYSFIVQPGADPSQVQVHIDGATSLSLDKSGNLLIGTAGGTLLQTAPVLFQTDSAGVKTAVTGQHVLLDNGNVGFQVTGDYDPSQPLTIDPVLNYSTYLGGSGDDKAYGIAVDGAGEAFVTGSTRSSNFPTTTGVVQGSLTGSQDTFITKLNSQGTGVIYSTYLAGTSLGSVDQGNGIALDLSNDAYVVGNTVAANFPVTAGVVETSPQGTGNYAYVAKLSPTGDQLLYSSYIGIGGTTANAVAVDAQQNVYITGTTPGSDMGMSGPIPFTTTGSAYQTTVGGGNDAYVLKLNATATSLTYATFLGGTGNDTGYGIALDAAGEATVGGVAASTFPTSLGAYQTTHSGGNTVGFVSKLNAAGSGLVFSTFLGGTGGDQVNAVATDGSGNINVTGQTNSTNFPTSSGAYQTANAGGTDAFVSNLSPTGTLTYSSYLGGGGTDVGLGIAVGNDGDVVVTGDTGSGGSSGSGSGSGSSTTFPTTSGAMQSTFAGGGTDAFVARLQPTSGAGLAYSSYLGGSNPDVGTAVSEDISNNAYVTGYTSSTDFPTAGTPFQGSSAGGIDAYIAKVLPKTPPPKFSSITTDSGSSASDQDTTDQTLILAGTSVASATISISRDGAGVIGTTTADGSGNWSYDYTAVTLPEGKYAFTATATVSGSTSDSSSVFSVTVDRTAPTVTLTAPSSTTSLAPVVTVTAVDPNNTLPDGTQVRIDVDLNNDGDFSDPGESSYTTGTLTGGVATITLPAMSGAGTYPIQARVTDLAGNEGTSTPTGSITITSVTSWGYSTPVVLTSDPLSGLAQQQLGDVHLSHALDLDLSPGTSASANAAIVYNSDSVNVKPIVQATLQSVNNAALPGSITASLTFNGSSTGTLTYSTAGLAAGDPFVIAAQAPSSITTTGRYTYTLVVSVPGQSPQTYNGSTFVVAQDASVFGAGWTFSPVDQLFSIAASGGLPAGVLRSYGAGEWSFYTDAGGGAYTSPAGDTGTLSLTAGTYTYSTPDGQKWTFNSSGYETGWASADGQQLLTFTYSGSNLSTMTAIDGTLTTFNYSSGKVSTIVTGNGRTTTLSYSSGSGNTNLTAITDPSPGGTDSFTYDANHKATSESFGGLQNQWAYSSSGALATLTWGSGSSPSVSKVAPAVVQGLSAAVRSPVSASVTDALTHTTAWLLDSQGRTLKQTDPNGAVTTWARDPSSTFATSVTDPLGTTTFAYDAAGGVTHTTFADGTTQSTAYQAAYSSLSTTTFHQVTASTDQRGYTTSYAYDSSGHMTLMTDALTDKTTYTYSSGLLQSVTDPLNHTTTYAYDTKRRLTTTTDALTHPATLTYDSNGNPQTSTDVNGHLSTMQYDALGRETGTVDALGHTTGATYDAAGLLLTQTDENGHVTSTIYDGYSRGLVVETIQAAGTANQIDELTSYDNAGRESQSRDADGNSTLDADDVEGDTTLITDAMSGKTVPHYNLANQQTSVSDPMSRVSQTGYNAVNNVTKTTDPRTKSTTYSLDAAGNQTSMSDPLGHGASSQLDALGRTTLNTDADGKVTTTVFDAAGNVSTVTDPDGNVTSYSYDALNRATAVTVGAGTLLAETTTTAYDNVGNATKITDSLGGITTYQYDAVNRQTTMIDQLGHTTTTAYDPKGNVTSTTDGLGKTTTTAFNALDEESSTTDPLSHTDTVLDDADGNEVGSIDAAGDVTKEYYDPLGREIASVDGNNAVTRKTYDAAGDLLSLTDADNNTTSWQYNQDGQQTLSTDPTGALTTTSYDDAGRVTSVVDRLGQTILTSYDSADRVTGVTWKAAGGATTNTQTFTYDNAGNLLTAGDNAGTYTYTYDGQERKATETNPFGQVLTFSYDAGNRATQVADSLGGTTTSVYDAANRLTTRELSGTGLTPISVQLTYTNRDQLGTLSRYSDVTGTTLVGTTSYTYDDAGRTTGILNTNNSAATISYYNTSYDSANRATSDSGTGTALTETYDATRQLLSDGTTTYSYDGTGNRTMAGYSTGTDNRTTTDGTWTYTYDADGEVTKKTKGTGLETWYYTWDVGGRLTNIRQTSDGSTNLMVTTYTYDVFGQRIQQDQWQSGVGTATLRFAWSGGQIWADMDGMNTLVTRYLYGDNTDQLLAREASATAAWTLTDRLGSVRDVINSAGTVLDHVDYSGFGVITAETNSANRGRVAWTGREFDSLTGLQNNRGRYYSPSGGKWWSEDPSGFAAGDTNLNRYVGNDTTNATDPTGLEEVAPGTFDQGSVSFTKLTVDNGSYNIFGMNVKDQTVSLKAVREAQKKESDFSKGLVLDADETAAMKVIGIRKYLGVIEHGLDVGITAVFNKGIDPQDYFWSQKYQINAGSTDKKFTAQFGLYSQSSQWDKSYEYPGPKRTKNSLEMGDTPTYNTTFPLTPIEAGGTTIFIKPKELKAYDDFVAAYNKNKGQFEMTFTTELRRFRKGFGPRDLAAAQAAGGLAVESINRALRPLTGGLGVPDPIDVISEPVGEYVWGFKVTSNPFGVTSIPPKWTRFK
jgi:RHS repeat-associated protein